jgi:hypothetical protein
MAKQTIISNTAAILLLQELVDALDAGSDLNIYDGTVPSDLDVPLTTQNLLVSISLPYPAFGAITDGTGKASTSLSAVISGIVTTAGTATFYRACNSSGDPVIQGTVGMLGADLILSATNLILGITVRVNSWNLHVSESQTVCP